MQTVNQDSYLIDTFKNSKSFYIAFGLVDGLDVSIGSLNYLAKALSITKDNEKSLLQALLTGKYQIASLGFISITTGLAVLSHYFNKKYPDSQLMPMQYWLFLRYLLKSSHNAVKVRFCLLPLINNPSFTNIINPLSPGIYIVIIVSVIGRSYHKFYSDAIKKDRVDNDDLLIEINRWQTQNGENISIQIILDMHQRIKPISTSSKYRILISAGLAGLIDKPHMFYGVMFFTITASNILLMVSAVFLLSAIVSSISKIIATQQQLDNLHQSQVQCVAALQAILKTQSLTSEDNQKVVAILSIQTNLPHSSSNKVAEIFKNFDIFLNIINFMPVSYIIYYGQMLLMSHLAMHFAVALSLLSVGMLVGGYYWLNTIKQYSPTKNDMYDYMLIISTTVVSYYKGIRLSNFSLKYFFESSNAILTDVLKSACIAILSLECVVNTFSRRSDSNIAHKTLSNDGNFNESLEKDMEMNAFNAPSNCKRNHGNSFFGEMSPCNDKRILESGKDESVDYCNQILEC
ncbi:hypothetical protein [Legionella sp. W05-934-2]|jgi:hypothetical protein|uniref:hypothetical protein n=1 Tax=Legionella sp. W05-934-2 TaxID=1198649 RepID=UPI00346247A8